jgi:small subunit ribosomal protein S17
MAENENENENVTDEVEAQAEAVEAADEAVAEAPADEVEEAVEAAEEPVEEPAAEAAEEPAAETDEVAEAEAVPAAAAEEAAEPVAVPAPQSGPKPKRKRLPRALRPKRTRPKREKATERKPIVRLEAPEHERGRRQERQGTVVSDAMEKTIVVRVDVVKAHPRYKKVVRRSAKFHVHDEESQAKVGDVVRIVETRPLSKTKRWRLAEVVESAK